MAPKVTVLGLGIMGSAMAGRLVGAGLSTTVWNRSSARAAAFEGAAEVADSPGAAVADADIVLTMLFDAGAVRSVMAAALPAMRRDAVWMQCSTVGVAAAREFSRVAARAGVRFVDAPVLGTKGPAESGTLTVLLAGPDDAVAEVAPAVAAISSRTVRAGAAAPAASGLKLAMNAWIATITTGIAQSLTIADRLGIDPELVLDTLQGQAADSPYAQAKGRAMLARQFDAQFELVGMLKDVRLAREAVPELPQALLAALDGLYGDAAKAGAGREDIAAVWKAFQA